MLPKPLTLRMQYAAMRSALPKEARHLVHVLSVLANSETGEGWHGQETIARLMGCSDRHVRTLLATLDKPNGSGIRIERRARFHRDGRGRTSDFWKLVSDADLPEDIDTTNRNTVPPEQGSTGTPRPTNRNATTDQPEPGSGDLRSDRRSERRSRSGARAPRGSQVPLIGDLGEPEKSQHQAVMACYADSYEAEHGEKPVIGSIEGKAVKDLLKKAGSAEKACEFIGRAFLSFRRSTVTIQQIAKDPSTFHPEALKRGQRPVQATTPELDGLGMAKGQALSGDNVVPLPVAKAGVK
jgi:hypothetical protein